MKKWIALAICCFIALCTFEAAAFPIENDSESIFSWGQKVNTNRSREDELDQAQEEMNWPLGPVGRFPLGDVNYSLAQSFTPQKKVLTRVELYIERNGTTTYPYVVAIRDDLFGEDLTRISVPSTQVEIENFSWVEFDFTDIKLTVNQTYWIVSYTANETENWYLWGLNLSDPYPCGEVAASIDDGKTWETNDTVDLCFRTYGRNEYNLEISLPRISFGVAVNFGNGEEFDLVNLTYEITIEGGLLGLINTTIGGDIGNIPSRLFIGFNIPVFGLGPISVSITVDDITIITNAFVIGFLVIQVGIPPT